jgi:hypothetical protein
MRGRETFKALSEGKVVFCPYTVNLYRMDEFGCLRSKRAGSDWGWADVCMTGRDLWTEECEVMEDYTKYVYTFKEAMRLMLMGFRMGNEAFSECVYRFDEFGKFLRKVSWEETAELTED